MNFSASKNLKIYNKIAFVFIWIFLAIGSLCLVAGISGGIITGDVVWTDVILPVGISSILFAGIEWVCWAFTRGFERIVEASEYTIFQVQKNDRPPMGPRKTISDN